EMYGQAKTAACPVAAGQAPRLSPGTDAVLRKDPLRRRPRPIPAPDAGGWLANAAADDRRAASWRVAHNMPPDSRDRGHGRFRGPERPAVPSRSTLSSLVERAALGGAIRPSPPRPGCRLGEPQSAADT